MEEQPTASERLRSTFTMSTDNLTTSADALLRVKGIRREIEAVKEEHQKALGILYVKERETEERMKILLHQEHTGKPLSFENQLLVAFGVREDTEPLLAFDRRLQENIGKIILILYRHQEDMTRGRMGGELTTIVTDWYMARINGGLHIPDRKESQILTNAFSLFPFPFYEGEVRGQERKLLPLQHAALSFHTLLDALSDPKQQWLQILIGEDEINSERDGAIAKIHIRCDDPIALFLATERKAAESTGELVTQGGS